MSPKFCLTYGRTDASFEILRDLRELGNEWRRGNDGNMRGAFPLGAVGVNRGSGLEHNTLPRRHSSFLFAAAIQAAAALARADAGLKQLKGI